MDYDKWVNIFNKMKNPFKIAVIIAIFIINEYLNIIEEKYILASICVILICLVLLKETIYKIVNRICERDEKIAKEKASQNKQRQKEKTIRKQEKYKYKLESKNNKNNESDTTNGDCKIYEIKRSTSKAN